MARIEKGRLTFSDKKKKRRREDRRDANHLKYLSTRLTYVPCSSGSKGGC